MEFGLDRDRLKKKALNPDKLRQLIIRHAVDELGMNGGKNGSTKNHLLVVPSKKKRATTRVNTEL